MKNLHVIDLITEYFTFFFAVQIIDVYVSFLLPITVIQAQSVPTNTDSPVVFSATSPKRKSAAPSRVKQGIVLEAETIEHLAEGTTISHSENQNIDTLISIRYSGICDRFTINLICLFI